MCVDPDWKPFEIIEDHKHKGIAADLIKLISKKLNFEIKLIETKTWQESLILSKEKKPPISDCLSLVAPTRIELVTSGF